MKSRALKLFLLWVCGFLNYLETHFAKVKLWRLAGKISPSSISDILVSRLFLDHQVVAEAVAWRMMVKNMGGKTQTLKHKRLYSIWVTSIHNLSDKKPHKVWDTTIGKWMRWIHKTCRKQMRWREKFFWWKICENELGDNIPHTLCIPQPQPFYNFLGADGGSPTAQCVGSFAMTWYSGNRKVRKGREIPQSRVGGRETQSRIHPPLCFLVFWDVSVSLFTWCTCSQLISHVSVFPFSSSKMEIAHVQSVHPDSTLTWLQVWALMTFLSGVGLQLYLCWIPIRSCAQCCGRAPTSTTQAKVQQIQAPLDSRAQQGRQWVWGRNNLHLQYQPNEASIEQASRYPQEALGLAKLLRRRRHWEGWLTLPQTSNKA